MLSLSYLADEKRNNLNALRLLLSVAVIYSHAFFLSKVRVDSLLELATHGQAYEGELAVDGFFVLSGFLITMSWLRHPYLGEFLKRRFLRIYPGFLVAFFLSVVVVGTLGAADAKGYLTALPVASIVKQWLTLGKISNLATFLSQHEPGQINGSLWTIRIEFECYLLVPVLAALGMLRRRAVVAALAMIAVGAHIGLPFVTEQGIHVPAFVENQGRFVAYFLFGMSAYLYREQLRYTTMGALLSFAALIVTAIFGGFHIVQPVAWSYLLLFIGFHTQLGWHHFGWGTDISYGMYLYGWPMKRIALLLFPSLSPYPLFLMAMILTIPVALLSWHLIEKPFLRMKEGQRPSRSVDGSSTAAATVQ